MRIVATILIFAVILSTCGCIDTVPPGVTPRDRLDRNPNLVAACQYEQWLNTSHQSNMVTYNNIISVTKTDVNWVCYYRDNHTSVQKIGSFENNNEAAKYIWYYYADHTMPFIKVMNR